MKKSLLKDQTRNISPLHPELAKCLCLSAAFFTKIGITDGLSNSHIIWSIINITKAPCRFIASFFRNTVGSSIFPLGNWADNVGKSVNSSGCLVKSLHIKHAYELINYQRRCITFKWQWCTQIYFIRLQGFSTGRLRQGFSRGRQSLQKWRNK